MTEQTAIAFRSWMPPLLVARSLPALRPFLKWAGGKRQLLPELRRFVPSVIGAYHEPFLGSGALFFDLSKTGNLPGIPCHLADANPDLIGVYRAVAHDTDSVITELRALAARHARKGTDAYYQVRDQRFNPQRRARLAASGEVYSPALAAMFIYLNRTGYNGLFRLNSRGDYNVPAGRYSNPTICDEANLRAWSQALGRPGVTLRVAPFDEALREAGQDDFVYLDPPYAPVSATARFTSYTAGGFDAAAQHRLQQAVIRLSCRRAFVLLSNSAAPQIRALYTRQAAKIAGLKATSVAARRAINSRASSRGPVREYLITNVDRRPA